MRAVLVIFGVLAAFARPAPSAETLVGLPPPLDALAPPAVARAWPEFAGLQQIVGATRPLTVRSKVPKEGRSDVFVRQGGRWVWAAASSFHAESPMIAGDLIPAHIGVLVRFQSTALYLWGEGDGQSPAAIPLTLYKSVRMHVSLAAATKVALYPAHADAPRMIALAGNEARFDFVPIASALVCASDEHDAAQCAPIAAPATESSFPSVNTGHILRVIHTPEMPFAVSALAPSLSVVRPRPVTILATAVESWLLLDLDSTDAKDVAVDFRSGGLALQRLFVRDVPLIPRFGRIDAIADRGLTVRASIRGVSMPLERLAKLLALPPVSGALGRLAFGQAKLEEDGVFRFPELPSGTYRLKLLSALAGNSTSDIALSSGTSTSVSFDAAPLVKGRLELTAGGAVTELPYVRIVRSGDIPASEREGVTTSDVADWIHAAAVEPDGSFAAAVPLQGSYMLRAQWGHGIASRDFTMSSPPADVDLGVIVVRNGASVRGVVHDCTGGELHLMPSPDLEHPYRLPVSDLRRTSIGNDGGFFIDGVYAGTWLLGATCGGRVTMLSPPAVAISDGQDVLLELRPSTQEPTPPAPRDDAADHRALIIPR